MSQAPALLGFDAACVQCGYNLRGLPESGACPECGAPVADSLRGDRLQFASPVFVARLVRGARLVWWGIGLLILGVLAAIGLSVFTIGAPGAAIANWFWPAAIFGSTILSLAGWWLLSTPDPAAEVHAERAPRVRLILRVGLVVVLITSALDLIASPLGPPPAPGPGPPTTQGAMAMVLQAAGIVAALGWIVSTNAAVFYVMHLARRIPDKALTKVARNVFGLALVVGVVFVASIVLALFVSQRVVGFIGCGFGLALLVLLVLYVSMIERLRSSLVAVRAAQAARGG